MQEGREVIISPLALEALQRIDRIFDIERDVKGKTAAERLAVRQKHITPLIQELEGWIQIPLKPFRAVIRLLRRLPN